MSLPDRALKVALDASDDAIVLTDASLHVVYINAGFTRLFGFEPHEVMGKFLSATVFGTHTDRGIIRRIRETMAAHGRCQMDAMLYHRSGQPRWASLVINASPADTGGPGGSITVITDITHTKMHEVLQNRVLEGMVRELTLPELMALVCREVERIAPEVTATILAVDGQGLLRPLAAPSLPPALCATLDGTPIGPNVGSCGTAAHEGRPVLSTDIGSDPRWHDYRALFEGTGLKACWSNPIANHHGQVIGTFAFYFREVRAPDVLHQRLVQTCLHLCAVAIERDSTHQRLHQLAFFDELTGLPNRDMFCSGAARTLAQLGQQHQPGALLYVDLNRFKQINDSQGREAGDRLLRQVAERLTSNLHARDLIGRLSGDEFVLLLSGCSTQQAVQTACVVLAAIAQPVDIDGEITVPHASVGLAVFPEDGSSVDTLLRHAEQAMYQAKRDGSQSWQLFSADMNARARQRAAIERELRQALAQRQLTLHYQPQVLCAQPRSLQGVEALTRWQHPQWGMVSPAQFIPVAEEAGLIHELTLWLLDEACQQLVQWRSLGLQIPSVAVNLSARSFHDPQFALQIEDTLLRHGLHASDLVLEITESVMMDSRPCTLANITQLQYRGFRLSLDDFGTGYSSLSYLHRLPISELKLDIAFVRDLPHSPTARALTLSVLSIAQSLNMVVVAEGIETREQLTWLKEHGCTMAQGYLVSRPLAAPDFAAWLSQATLEATMARSPEPMASAP